MTIALTRRDGTRLTGLLRAPQTRTAPDGMAAHRPSAQAAAQTPPLSTNQSAAQSGSVHDARDLTGAGGTCCIMLDGQAYVLRITRAGKLILTK